MTMMSQAFYEETVSRAGLLVCGGNLSLLPHADPLSSDASDASATSAWAGCGKGLFVIDAPNSEIVDLDAVSLRDVIACTVVIGGDDTATDFSIGDRRFGSQGSEMTMAFVPRGERLRFVTQARRRLRALTIVFDPSMIMKLYGLQNSTLPKSLLKTLNAGASVMDKLIPGRFGMIASDIVARRNVIRPAAAMYCEGKTLELIATLLGQLSQRDAIRTEKCVFDPGTLQRLEEVKRIIDRASHRALDIDALARVAAMNRTKLRSCFKQAYGTTLSDYRATRLLQEADKILRESGATVKQAAHRAGYASASSFIVAYKRQYGICPGDVLQRENNA